MKFWSAIQVAMVWLSQAAAWAAFHGVAAGTPAAMVLSVVMICSSWPSAAPSAGGMSPL